MIEYFLLGLMMMCTHATHSGEDSICESQESDWFHCWESNVKEGTCTGEPNSAWIRVLDGCNGREDCPNGEDEAMALCKQHPDLMNSEYYFYCATGAVLELSKKCDGKVDCSDGSDEMPAMCQPKEKINRQGKCKKTTEFECKGLPGKCISAIKKCNGIYNCANGFDESLEVCYQQWHNTSQFQCGNGRLIPAEKICNGRYDCVDGSDELGQVCASERVTNKCQEPPAPLMFTQDTKYHRGINGTKYVLPSEVVQVQCIPSTKLVGFSSGWNVCGVYGRWKFSWPRCI